MLYLALIYRVVNAPSNLDTTSPAMTRLVSYLLVEAKTGPRISSRRSGWWQVPILRNELEGLLSFGYNINDWP